jgi:exosome complex component RRP42
MSSMDISNLNIDFLKKMFSENKRFDGRGLSDYREIEVSHDVSNKAEGSARVKIGKTEVIVGVKLALAEPYPDSPDKGNLMVSADLLPLASPRFESGPPRFPAIELPRIVDRGIRESGMIDLSKLVVTPGEKVWSVMIDIYPINDDGNLVDASAIGAIVALKNSRLPSIDKDGKIDYETKTKNQIPLAEGISPIMVTFYKIGNLLILDPTREEEEGCETRISFGVSLLKGKHMINSSQKSGGGTATLTQEELEKIMEVLPEKFDELSKKLKKFL